MRIPRRFVNILLSCFALLGCSSLATGPFNSSVAGFYVLASASTRGGPSEGSLFLGVDGRAERRVRYLPTSGAVALPDYSGSYRFVSSDTIQLSFDDGSFAWRVRASVGKDELVMTYPHPADGTVEERYRRSARP